MTGTEKSVSPSLRRFAAPGSVIALAWCAYQFYLLVFGFQTSQLQNGAHLAFALALSFIPAAAKNNHGPGRKAADAACVVFSLAMGTYLLWDIERLTSRMEFVEDLFFLDYFFGLGTIILILEACRRFFGYNLVIVAAVFIAYGVFGSYMPGGFMHRGMGVVDFVEINFMTTQGVFGIPLAASSQYIFYFIVFAAFLERSGGGDLFIDLAFRLTGRYRGGSAKTAIVASGLMGSISGSAVANVASTGVFTIPLMKRTGYTPVFAGAIEAVASTGGQIMPPVMGAAAFIMTEMLGVAYVDIIASALLPAAVYYISLYLMVDLKARQENIRGVPASELPLWASIFKRIYLIAPLVVLVGAIIYGVSLTLAAGLAIACSALVGVFRPGHAFSVRSFADDFLDAMISGAGRVPKIAVPSALAGIVIGVISFTGIGLKFSHLIIHIASGHLLPALLLVMFACIILGMGMPTASAYILVAVLLAPVLIDMGIPALAAHFFIFYFAILSMVTPPVALAAYAAAGISGSDINRTGFVALLLSLAGFIVPFMFVYNPALLLLGHWTDAAIVFMRTILGVYALSGVLLGYFFNPLNAALRLLLTASAVLMIVPHPLADAGGVALFFFVIFFQKRKQRQAAAC